MSNQDGFDITQIKFDLSTTTSLAFVPFTNGGTFGESGPAGGTATPFSSSEFIFGYNFTSFNHGDAFQFNLDPDIVSDGSYGQPRQSWLERAFRS